ncbi:MAG TPA: phage holin family protein, partial [Gaiellaceae bacterium]|nr:phage holin family protein [Gaiellaceae bacterium]
MSSAYGERPGWSPQRPRYRLGQVVLSWVLVAASLVVATKLVPGASDSTFQAALVVAALVALLNALLPPLVAALRLPFMALLGFFLILALDAGMLLLADRVSDGLTIDSFWAALGVALVASAVGVVLSIVFGTNDDDVYSLRVVQRIARRSGGRVMTDVPGIVFLEIDGLALPVLQRAMRDGHAPTMARWLADGTHRLAEWEPDLSSQTGSSQAGILLGSNED